MSETRKRYWFRLAGRCVVFALCCLLYALRREEFAVLKGWSFFQEFSVLHLLWLVWAIDTIQQIVPIKKKLPLGSMKLFASRFRPIRDRINYEALHSYIVTTTKAAYKVFLIWCAGLAVIGGLYYSGVLGPAELFLISAAFCVRSDLRADLVPLPAPDAHPLLYHLPDLQLGPPDDVHPHDLHGRLLRCEPAEPGLSRLAGLGGVHYDVPRAVLGQEQCRPQMLRVHR